ncbi:CPBP family intramembrane glutamic endopeptidase [Arenicella xantha]|uniref:CAAX prenyl protease-like protein n=1 Tax=Arenicella xantha TaxID=644221 RepID=A0A395JQ71_9GAMM|nr:type II CAAX endopeptidase family protein [Arenicella xantha]RBP53810.1 CAAX prenyl protease-like protein [Arenicella xantha]
MAHAEKTESSASIFPIHGRYLVFVWLFLPYWVPGLTALYFYLLLKWPVLESYYWFDVVYYYYFYGLFGLTLVAGMLITRTSWQPFFSPIRRSAILPSLELTLFIFVFSSAAIYWVFWPLAYVAPNFVQAWLIDLPGLIYWDGAGYPALANLLGFCSLVILAPVFEELVFRGVLLQRWSTKFSTHIAVMLSSAIFAAVHTDPLGAFAFGLAMSYLAIRTGSLWLPILCHALNNLAVWLIELAYLIVDGPDTMWTLQDLKDEWWLGLIYTALACVWALRIVKRIPPIHTWRAAD